MNSVTISILGVLFGLLFLPHLYRLAVFAYTYLPIHNGDINRYLWPTKPYALVTGATDGIGKALALELHSRGFHLILHGRNEEKLQRVKEEIDHTSTGGARDVQYFVADAAEGTWNFEPLKAQLKDIVISVVVHVVGSSGVKSSGIDGQSEEDIRSVISRNALFPLYLTRALLPSLRAAALYGPVTVVSLGSLATLGMPPYLTTYSASKMFLETLSRGLSVDERFSVASSTSSNGKRAHHVEFRYLQVASVNSASNKTPVSLTVPSSEDFARDIVHRIACPERTAAANFVHALSAGALGMFGERVAEAVTRRVYERLHGADLRRKAN